MRFEKRYIKGSQIAKRLQQFFKPKLIEQKARESKFVKRDSKLTGSKFVQMCIVGIANEGITKSLNELCTICSKLDVEIVEQSLNERFNPNSVEMLKALFNVALATKFEESELQVLSSFSQIVLEDSTIFKLPENLAKIFQGFGGSASQSAIKIDYTYDFKTDYFNVQLFKARRPDISMELPDWIEPKSLWLRDLGYYKVDNFKKIDEADAYYLSRFKYDGNVYLSEDKAAKILNLRSVMRKMKVNQTKSMMVFVGQKKRFKTRLVLQKVPSKVANKRRKRLIKQGKKNGKPPTSYRLDLCGLSAYVTNLEETKWDVYQLIKLYKIRWQIEIIFKVWKSVLKIGEVKKMKTDRLLCLLYAQLIWAIINMRIFQSFKNYFWNRCAIEISEIKTYKIMRNFQDQLIQAICSNRKILYEKFFNNVFKVIKRLGKKQYKKGNPNPLFLILNS